MKRAHELAFRMIRRENGSLLPQGVWLFHSSEEWESQGRAFELDGALAVTPFDPPPAEVDWKHESVILVSAGERTNSPSSVKVLNVDLEGHLARVKAEITGPGGLAAPCYPWEIAAVKGKNIKGITVEFSIA